MTEFSWPRAAPAKAEPFQHTAGPWKETFVANSPSRGQGPGAQHVLRQHHSPPLSAVSSLLSQPHSKGGRQSQELSWRSWGRLVLPCSTLAEPSPWKREDGADLVSLPLLLPGLSLPAHRELLWGWRCTSEADKLWG